MSLAGAQIAQLFTSVEGWASERDGLENLNAMLSARTLAGHAEHLRVTFLAEVAGPLENARAAKPSKARPGRPIENHHLNAALSLAERFGWAAEDVAAILLLVGVERVSWTSLRDKVRKAFGRTKLAAV